MGIAIGLAVAAPIGPINLMCIRNSLGHGIWAGLFTGIGAVLGDGTFAAIAAFGVTAISEFFVTYTGWIHGIGGAALLAIGIRTIFVVPAPGAIHPGGATRQSIALIGTTYILTITNPATMLGFLAIFGGLGSLGHGSGDYAGAGLLVAAIMAGSLLWWGLISWVVSLFKHKFNQRRLRLVNVVSGFVIAGFGLAVLIRTAMI